MITEEVVCTPDVKMFAISMSVSKTLVMHLPNDCNYGIVELFKGEQLEHIQDKFYELNFPNVCNLVVLFKHRLSGGYIDNIFELKSKSQYDYIQECLFPWISSWTKGVHFQDVHKWCGEWNESCHKNVAYKGFVDCLDHV